MKLLTLLSLGFLAISSPCRADDGGAAQAAFAKTLANGKSAWILQNLTVSYAEGQHQHTHVVWTKACATSEPLRLEGSYPELVASFPIIDCGNQKPVELSYFQLLTSQLRYSASYIPAMPDDPNQFRLNLASMPTSALFSWKQGGSLNALTRDHEVFLDLQGEAQEGFGNFDERSYHYVAISIKQDPISKAFALRATYDFDRSGMRDDRSVEIQVQATLTR